MGKPFAGERAIVDMPEDPAESLAHQFSTDIRILSEILSNRGLSDSGAREIYSASYRVRKRDGRARLLSFEVPNIDLKIDPDQRVMPDHVQIDPRLLVDITFEENLILEPAHYDIFDRVTKNEIKFQIRGRKGNRELLAYWHFDRHAYPLAENSPCHPAFHFQFGGSTLRGISDNIAGILLLEAPRHSAPPMDPILAIDVLVSHFNGPKWHELRNQDRRYLTIVRRAQSRLWKPYFESISSDLDTLPQDHPLRETGLLPNIL